MQSKNAGVRPKRPTSVILLRKDSAKRAPGETGQTASPSRKKRVTIADIARHAGVSPSAVSITLADRRDISLLETTRDRIKRSADELGYFPSRLGKGFLYGRSKLVGVLIVSESYIPFVDCMKGIQEGLAAADYTPLVLTSNWLSGYAKSNFAAGRNSADELPDLRRLLEYQVEGVIYFSFDAEHTAVCISELASRKIPAVILGGMDARDLAVDVVGGDNEAIGRMAADHLLSAGCASFAFGKSTISHPLEEAVHSSFVARLEAAGHTCGDFTVDMENPADLDRLLSRLVRPPAGVFAAREEVAALALNTAFSLGWRVPCDFSVAGMGQTLFSRFSPVPITTVDRNSFAVGEAAAKLLIERIKGCEGQPQRILIPPTLTARTSSASDVSWSLCSTDSV